jgi:hypothetical protein
VKNVVLAVLFSYSRSSILAPQYCFHTNDVISTIAAAAISKTMTAFFIIGLTVERKLSLKIPAEIFLRFFTKRKERNRFSAVPEQDFPEHWLRFLSVWQNKPTPNFSLIHYSKITSPHCRH